MTAAELPGPGELVRVTPALLGELASQLRTNHPALRAAQARIAASVANTASIRTWEDPTARVGFLVARPDMRADEGDVLYGIEQKLPLFRKPEAARRVAAGETALAEAGAEYQFQTLRLELNRAVLRAALAEREVQWITEDLGWIDTLAATVEEQHRAGQSPPMDFLRVKSDRAKRADQLVTARLQLEHERVAVNRLLARELHSPLPRFDLPLPAGPLAYSERLVNYAVRFEPKLKLMRREIEQAGAVVEATRRQRYPDVAVGVEAATYSGNGSFRSGALMFSVRLPWGNAGKYRQDIEREVQKQRAAELESADYALTVREEVHKLTTRIDAARREALLYRDEILPRAETALVSARAMWESGRGPFRDLLETRRMIVEGRSMLARAVAEQYAMMSELVLCCGLGDLEALEMLGGPGEIPADPAK